MNHVAALLYDRLFVYFETELGIAHR